LKDLPQSGRRWRCGHHDNASTSDSFQQALTAVSRDPDLDCRCKSKDFGLAASAHGVAGDDPMEGDDPMASHAFPNVKDCQPRAGSKEVRSDDLPTGLGRSDGPQEDSQRAKFYTEANEILDDIEREMELHLERANEAALRLVAFLMVDGPMRDNLHHEERCEHANANRPSPRYREPRKGEGQPAGPFGGRVLGFVRRVVEWAGFHPIQQSRDRPRSPADDDQQMEYAPIPGAWIVETTIAGLVLLLIAMGIGFPLTIYSAAISLTTGGLIVKVLHARRKWIR
jgi:hypothetical protein